MKIESIESSEANPLAFLQDLIIMRNSSDRASKKVNSSLRNKIEGLSPAVVLEMPLVLFVVIRQSLFSIADDNRRKRRL